MLIFYIFSDHINCFYHKKGRLFGGMINDIKRRMPMYKSDIKDGLNSETLAATLFLYFAGLATGKITLKSFLLQFILIKFHS